MNLESLPNEIFLDLFDYIDDIDLLCTFYNLNSRFNLLLHKQFRFYCFNFTYEPKRNFDLICKQHLPFIADRIFALTLSNFEQTPQQINLFLSYVPSFNQFTRLQSITISELCSYEILLKFLHQCQHLNSLTHLNMYSCSVANSEAVYQVIIDNVWSLSKLTNCYIEVLVKEQTFSCVPTIISSSLECITIRQSAFNMAQINQLFEYTPRLNNLWINITSINNDSIPSSFSTLNRLKISFSDVLDYPKLVVFFQNTPNLCYLNVKMLSTMIDGHQWKNIIGNYLLKLKTFQLRMRIELFHVSNIKERVNELIDSFRTPFWIDKHQWFVRCIEKFRVIHLHTLNHTPDYRFIYWFARYPDSWRSTCPQDNQHEFYKNLSFIGDSISFDQPIFEDICLSNLKYLEIKFPINDRFWSIVPNLRRLQSLTVSSYTDAFQSELQKLLDRAPYLKLLEVKQDESLPLQMSLFKCTNTSVKLIDLHDYNHYFNEEECILFSHSPLGPQCEVLFISVNNRESIIYLLKNMMKLRILHIYWIDKEIQIINQLVQWLKDHLPSTYLVVNHSQYGHNTIIIWI